jgi:antitoxin (DNA-binding transcriptional repressor) of toxin-antitoxin stability system
MYHMVTVSVRDLRYDFKKIERILREGEEIRITKRHQVIGRLVPEPRTPVALPDFMGRLRTAFGTEPMQSTGAEIVRMDRNDD